MALSSPAGPINPEEADNFEEIEKQFAVKGESQSDMAQLSSSDQVQLSNT